MMKEGDVVMVYADAERCRYPIGQARLIRQVEEYKKLEMWWVEYLDYPDRHFKVFLHKPDVPIKNNMHVS